MLLPHNYLTLKINKMKKIKSNKKLVSIWIQCNSNMLSNCTGNLFFTENTLFSHGEKLATILTTNQNQKVYLINTNNLKSLDHKLLLNSALYFHQNVFYIDFATTNHDIKKIQQFLFNNIEALTNSHNCKKDEWYKNNLELAQKKYRLFTELFAAIN